MVAAIVPQQLPDRPVYPRRTWALSREKNNIHVTLCVDTTNLRDRAQPPPGRFVMTMSRRSGFMFDASDSRGGNDIIITGCVREAATIEEHENDARNGLADFVRIPADKADLGERRKINVPAT